MAGTISMTGIGSGMDVNAMIDALVSARGAQQKALKARATSTRAASTAISDIGSLLSKLKTAVDGLADPIKAQGFAATSSGKGVEASVTGVAGGGRYSVQVERLAAAYRAYSNPQADAGAELGLSGPLNIYVGTTSGSISITESDSLNSIAKKINSANLGVQATTFYDGNQYRLQVSGLNAGADHVVTVDGAVTLGLEANVKQQAQSAHAIIDGFDVYSATNQIVGTIPGVTLTLKEESDTPVSIETKSDPETIKTKAQAVVDAYNAVIKKVQSTAGYGTTKASNELLAGDSTLRNLTARMSRATTSVVETGSEISTLNSIGISLTRDGQLTLDSAKFGKALTKNAEAVTKVLAGTTSGDGIMDLMGGVVDMFNQTGTGLLANKRTTLEANAKRMETRANEEQDRMDAYRAQLEKQFSVMDTSVSTSNSISAYLSALSNNS